MWGSAPHPLKPLFVRIKVIYGIRADTLKDCYGGDYDYKQQYLRRFASLGVGVYDKPEHIGVARKVNARLKYHKHEMHQDKPRSGNLHGS